MNKTDVDIIIVRGAPASGKSETAKCLAKYFPQGVRIEIDNLRSMVISVDWTNQQEHINILQLSTKLVSEFLSLGFKPIIIIDTFSGDKIDKYLSDLQLINCNLKIALLGLYVTEKELTKRINKRKEGKFKDIDICLKLNSDVLKIKHLSEIQINTTECVPQETAQIIMNILS
ncbi:MAG: AAA family ATPase [Prevotellaceae bacterium]|jgi:tRNA uridine 5-carbamoylmethylation protein Kti12|nr:AAA family ATPase [Prevotellaceae bacterium]